MKFLHELVEFLYPDQTIAEHELKRLIKDQNATGSFWEDVLAKAMADHTTICERRNQPGKDFYDGTDAKFAMAGRYTDRAQRVATIGIENKIGSLRVCLCFKGDKFHKVFFMKIPHDAYKDLQGQNIKITFTNFEPHGAIWNKFRCSWEEVIAPEVDKNTK